MPKKGPAKKVLTTEAAEALKAAASGARSIPHLSELAEHFISVSGGPRALAKMLYEEWAASAPGTLVRTRILDLMSRIWRYASDTIGHHDDLGILNETDIKRELDKIIEDRSEAPPPGPG